jgi:hypothetical protein
MVNASETGRCSRSTKRWQRHLTLMMTLTLTLTLMLVLVLMCKA